jgi:DNA-binding response OmpR family regulator
MSDQLAGVIYLQKPFRPAELVRAVDMARAAVQQLGNGSLSARAG